MCCLNLTKLTFLNFIEEILFFTPVAKQACFQKIKNTPSPW